MVAMFLGDLVDVEATLTGEIKYFFCAVGLTCLVA
jgi:hypothetical protein